MTGPLTNPTAPPRRTWSPWRVVVGFGTISLAGSLVIAFVVSQVVAMVLLVVISRRLRECVTAEAG